MDYRKQISSLSNFLLIRLSGISLGDQLQKLKQEEEEETERLKKSLMMAIPGALLLSGSNSMKASQTL